MTTITAPHTAKPASRAAMLLPLVIDFGLPLLVYYGLRATGVDQWWSLLLSAVVPAIVVIARFVRTRDRKSTRLNSSH